MAEKDWASYVRSIRTRLGMNRQSFSKFLGIAEVSLISWELNKRIPNNFYQGVLERLNQRLEEDNSGDFWEQLEKVVSVIVGAGSLAYGTYKLLEFLFNSSQPQPKPKQIKRKIP